ncbi:MAG: anaerobic sulfatase maturase [Victivallaceae bacterium]|nr:anaerobic sulfatase maturase [Victivallaceae bacterium]
MKPFSLLVKPASFGCNLRCTYCFYLVKEQLYAGQHTMTDAILEQMISSFMAVPMPNYSFGWQGGEPTIMGLDFYKRAIKLMQQYGRSGKAVSNGLQTNGTLLDDEWGKFLHQYNFLVGISIDGPEKIHNLNRFTINGDGSHQAVMNGLNVLKRHNVEHNVLTLVSSANAEHPLEIYDYLKTLGLNYHQYIECIEFDSNNELMPFAVKPEQWGEFLCQIFDEWYKNDHRTVSVRLFDSILVRMVDNNPNVCAMAEDCRQYFVVENNGDVYPCDFFVSPEMKLGNILGDDWKSLYESQLYKDFGARKAQRHDKCAQCQYLMLCNGCCPKNRPGRGSIPGQLSALCSGWEIFYQHTLPRFKILADQIRRERQEFQQQEMQRRAMAAASQQQPHPSRNAPCSCGSGKKFKQCCGKPQKK